jgi:hypothetical protein
MSIDQAERDRMKTAAIYDRYINLYQVTDEEGKPEENIELEKMKGLILQLARCEYDIEKLYTAQEESGGIILEHPKVAGKFKPNPINGELIKMRAQYINILQMIERHLGDIEGEEDDGLGDFI